MSLTPGTRLGPYEVVSAIGAGGMGEVYRATDTKLKRDVAIKVLPDLFVGDSDRLARFQREAQVLASLNHPHIGAIHGLEESGGTRALVLELVEGPTLADRIAQGPIPLVEALPIAQQIAEALEAAHERGIVHRDLKPANVKLRDDDVVKVLDFGLAKAITGDSGVDPSMSPTVTGVATRAGLIMGTAAYMSPEQARGRPIDKRTDIWAFGCVLYEMLTGKATFAKDNVSDTLSAVLNNDPDWTALDASVPASVRTLLQRCLERDRKRRIGDISTALFVLSEPGRSSAPALVGVSPTPQPRLARRGVAAMAAAILVAALGSGAAVWLALRPAPARIARWSIAPSGPAALSVARANPNRRAVISSDAANVVYIGNNGTQLFARPLDRLEPVALTKPGAPVAFCLSPDGQSVAFIEQYVMKKVAVSGGPVVTLGSEPGNVMGMTWGERGTIVIGDDSARGLIEFPDTGGTEKVLTEPHRERGEVDHLWPEFLPGGRAVLFTITGQGGIDNAQVAVLDLGTGEQKVLIRGGSHAKYVSTGHLVYGAAGTLRAIKFDLDRLETRGADALVLPDLSTSAVGSADFDVASDGTLIYVPGGVRGSAATLVWVDRRRREEPIKLAPRAFRYPRLSPDGTRVALDVRDQDNDIWILELATGTLSKFTSDPTVDRFPVWTHDGTRLLFASDRGGVPNVYWQAANGSGTAEPLMTQQAANEQMPMSVTPDGVWAVVRHRPFSPPQPSGDLLLRYDLSLVALSEGHRIQPLLSSAFSEQNAEISEDGHWLAYQSDDTGHHEIYVRSFPLAADRGATQVSSGGGRQPLWSRDSHELFYIGPADELMGVKVSSGPTWTASVPTTMLDPLYMVGPRGGEAFGRNYDISRDGSRFLMAKAADDPAATGALPSVVVVQHWFDELRRVVPAK